MRSSSKHFYLKLTFLSTFRKGPKHFASSEASNNALYVSSHVFLGCPCNPSGPGHDIADTKFQAHAIQMNCSSQTWGVKQCTWCSKHEANIYLPNIDSELLVAWYIHSQNSVNHVMNYDKLGFLLCGKTNKWWRFWIQNNHHSSDFGRSWRKQAAIIPCILTPPNPGSLKL